MKLHELKPNAGARKDKHRKGRGHAAGKGKQAGKGQSGQNKRGGTRPGFEGGQNPWFRRLPKRGFNNHNHIEYQVVSLDVLEKKFNDGDTVDFDSMIKAKIIRRNYLPVKILNNGKISKKITITVAAASAGAIAAIEAAGGKVVINTSAPTVGDVNATAAPAPVAKEEIKVEAAPVVEETKEEKAEETPVVEEAKKEEAA